MTRNRIDTSQGVVALVGITLGLIPLVQKLLTGSTGSLWQLLFDGEGVLALTAAVVVTVGAVLIVAVLERAKGR